MFALGNAAPNIEIFSAARGAAHNVYAIIDQVSGTNLLLSRYIHIFIHSHEQDVNCLRSFDITDGCYYLKK